VTTLKSHGKFPPNWGNERDVDLGRIRVYFGPLDEDSQLVDDINVENSDSLGGIPFGKMEALEAVTIQKVRSVCEGSFSSLLLRPSLQLLQMEDLSPSMRHVIGRIEKDVSGRRILQVETLVLWMWILPDDSPHEFMKSLRKLFALFPNLKSLRLRGAFMNFDGVYHCVGLGRLVRRRLPFLSELVFNAEQTILAENFGAYVRLVLRGLGSGWKLAPVRPGSDACTLRFVADARDRAKFSSSFFDDKFFLYV
jgi:hypothetical protein